MTYPTCTGRFSTWSAGSGGHPGAKDEAVRVAFGLSPWRYQQLVFEVCQTPAALAADPLLVNRVNRGRRVPSMLWTI